MKRTVSALVLALIIVSGCSKSPSAKKSGESFSSAKELSGLADCSADRGSSVQLSIGSCPSDCIGFFHPVGVGANDAFAFLCENANNGVVEFVVPPLPSGDFVVTCNGKDQKPVSLCRMHLEPKELTGSAGGEASGGQSSNSGTVNMECSANSDCAAGKSCVNGQCVVPPAAECTQDSDCSPGKTCQGGSCVVQQQQPPQQPQPQAAPDCNIDGTAVQSSSQGIVQQKWSCTGAVFQAYVYGPFSGHDPQNGPCLKLAVASTGQLVEPNLPGLWTQYGKYSKGIECKNDTLCAQKPAQVPVTFCRVDVIDKQESLNEMASSFYTEVSAQALSAQNTVKYYLAYRAKNEAWKVKEKELTVKPSAFNQDPTIEAVTDRPEVKIKFACSGESKEGSVKVEGLNQNCTSQSWSSNGGKEYEATCPLYAPAEAREQEYTVTCPGFGNQQEAKVKLKFSLSKAMVSMKPGPVYQKDSNGDYSVQVCANAGQDCGDGGLLELKGSVTRDITFYRKDPQTSQWAQIGNIVHVPWVDEWLDFTNRSVENKVDYTCSAYKEKSIGEWLSDKTKTEAAGLTVDTLNGVAYYNTKLFLQPNCTKFIFGLRKTQQMSVDEAAGDFKKAWVWKPDEKKAFVFEMDTVAQVGGGFDCYGAAYADDPCDKFAEIDCDDLPMYHHKWVDLHIEVDVKGVKRITSTNCAGTFSVPDGKAKDGFKKVCDTLSYGCDLEYVSGYNIFEKHGFKFDGSGDSGISGTCKLTAEFFDGSHKDQAIAWDCNACITRKASPPQCHPYADDPNAPGYH